MNKYFLSTIFIFAIFDIFRVFNKVFLNDMEVNKSYKITSISESLKDNKSKQENLKEEVDIEEMLKVANVKNDKKLFKKCYSCHDVLSDSKIKAGPTLWKIVGKDYVKIDEFKYSNSFNNLDKISSYEELLNFLRISKHILLV